ncbi:MAG: diguanylate cyclase domain-containing protein [Armatimonadota bacterium]
MTKQLDYIFFFYGLSFIVLAIICFMSDRKISLLPWRWLGYFGLIHGLNEWLDMLALSLGDFILFKLLRIIVMAVSFFCLVEFGRLGTVSFLGKGPGKWISLVLIVIGCAGYAGGLDGLNVSIRYALGFTGGIWSAYLFLLAGRYTKNLNERRNLYALGILLALYAITSGVIVPKAEFLPASIFNHDSFLQIFGFPVQLLRGILALLSAIFVWQILGLPQTQRVYRISFVCSMFLILVGGWYFTNRAGISEYEEWINKLQSTCEICAASISSDLIVGIDSIEYLGNPRYEFLKERLMNMREKSPEFRYIYLMVVRNGKIIFAADSEPVNSKDYSPPGDEYADAPAELKALSHGSVRNASAEYSDKWGKWISAFVPLKNDSEAKPTVILGMDYPQDLVYRAVSSHRLSMIIMTLMAACLAFLLFYFRERREWLIKNVSDARDSLQLKEEHLSCTLHSIGDAVIATDCDGYVTRINEVAESLTGWNAENAIGRSIEEILNILSSLTREPVPNPILQVLATGESADLENGTIIISKDGKERQIADSCSPIRDNQNHIIGVIFVFHDVTEEYRQRNALLESEDKYRSLISNANESIFVVQDSSFKLINPMMIELLDGYSEQDIINKSFADFIFEDDRNMVVQNHRQRIANLATVPRYAFRVVTYNKVVKWVEINATIIQWEGRPATLNFLTDITDRVRAEDELQNEKDNLAAIFKSSPVGMLLLDEETMIVDANSVIATMVSRNLSEVINQRGGGGLGCVHSLEHADGCGFAQACPECTLRQGITQVLKSGVSIRGVEIQSCLLIDDIENRPWLRVSAEPVTVNNRKHVIVAIDDITEHKKAEEALVLAKAETERLNRQLEEALIHSNEYALSLEIAKSEIEENAIMFNYQANHDMLTGLPNRFYFEQRLNDLIRNSNEKMIAILFLDLDKFKLINDTLGHKAGDLLLIEVAKRLQSCLRSNDILARMGGDEFTVILPNGIHHATVESIASRMIDCISRPFEIHSNKFVIGASIGIASYPTDGIDTVTLIKHADAAMYKAKQTGRGRFCWYSGDVDVENKLRADMEMDIQIALEK